jgi:hypothetical protein
MEIRCRMTPLSGIQIRTALSGRRTKPDRLGEHITVREPVEDRLLTRRRARRFARPVPNDARHRHSSGMTTIRQRRFLLFGAVGALLTLGLLVVRVSCLDGTVYWGWGWGGDVVRICEGRLLLVYVVLEQWALLLGGVVLAAIIWQRSRTPS